MIDERAHAILAEEKAANARLAEQAAQKAAAHRAREELDAQVKVASDAYNENLTEPPTLVGSVLRSMVVIFITTFVLGALPFVGGMTHGFLFPAIGFTPSSVVCPSVCDGCEASARVVRSSSGKSHAFLCKNDRVDVTTVSYNDLGQDRLKPYILSCNTGDKPHFGWFTGCIVDALVIAPCLAVLFGPLAGVRRRRRRLAERPELKAKLDALEEQVRLLDAKAPSAPPFR
jgi:hypothetical protein